jgi:signal peptidase I
MNDLPARDGAATASNRRSESAPGTSANGTPESTGEVGSDAARPADSAQTGGHLPLESPEGSVAGPSPEAPDQASIPEPPADAVVGADGDRSHPPSDWLIKSDSAAALDRPGDEPGEGDDSHATAVAQWRNRSERRRKPHKKRPFWVELPILIVIAFGLTFLIQTFIAKVYYVPSGSMEKTLHGAPSGGDRILVSKIVYDFRDPRQGDVDVFKGTSEWPCEACSGGATTWYGKALQAVGSVIGIAPPDESDFVKRVIAVGGQTVQCCDAQGNVQVDGRSLNEPYIYQPIPFTPGDPSNDCTTTADGRNYTSARCFGPIKVPQGQLFMMGDHRLYSSDSSYNCQRLTAKAMADEMRPEGYPQCARVIPVDNVIGKAIFIVMPPSRWGTIGDPDIDPSAQSMSLPPQAVPVTGGLLLTMGLRGGLAMTPARRRRRKARRLDRRAARASQASG